MELQVRRFAEIYMNSAQIAPVNRRKDVDNRRSGHQSRSRGTGPTRKRRTRTMSQTTPLIDKLAPLRAHKGKRRTTGLDDATLAKFAASHPELAAAVDAAAAEYANIKDAFADLLDLDEDAQVQAVQAGFVNFYPQDGVNPYVALAARGPWIVTLNGAVLYDTGGYGMLGFGHAPPAPKTGRGWGRGRGGQEGASQ